MAVLLRKMLGIGNLPDDIREQLQAEGILHVAEFVPVTFRFAGHVPGKVAKSTLRSLVGAVVVTEQRLLGTLSSAPKKAVKTINHLWDAPDGTMVQAELDETGMLLDAPDISAVDPCFTGSMSLRYKTPLPADVLAALPARTFTFDVPNKYVYVACGMPPTA
ncbi:hypothetical protein FZI85_11830 [Mycobacterium sp. CBMA293]|uniref:hypothetical protein n=1 Tax=unclassified Mycolicibacterium TaxID=2636767 RepID=UPI0012DC8C26|nr:MULTISPECIES: hypothetical protein [unclassified Mycolicibacterium]MUL47928.1 hypothetical protein [Mycolicibacterium sp. CBMA 360]MUL59224.1 hypothetical protein [Mycolicibacterium sp. CBMA 335]MUL64148.1 hypothetical protein [Mycolicibacterium sp. CBMA 234]MUL70949.1 hypothetical protein [Mycolicibacterium sp. CBMA 311]MUL94592.1 hypothetical protein [Mycolicibacterium sp. CBMA 230]